MFGFIVIINSRVFEKVGFDLETYYFQSIKVFLLISLKMFFRIF